MDFGNILKRAWEIIWNHKILWLFGILASCGSGGGSGGNFGFSGSAFGGDVSGLPPNMQRFFNEFARSVERIRPEEIFAIAAGIIVFAFLLAIVFFFLRTLGRVALIKGAHQAELGEKLSFRQLFNDSKPYYWRALGLSLLLGIAVFLVAFIGIILAAILGLVTLGFGLLCLIPLICLLVPIAIGYGVFVEFTNNALVIEDLGIGDAMQRGWNVLRANVGNVAVMALILIIGGGILTFLIILPLFFAFAPMMASMMFDNSRSFQSSVSTSGFLLLVAIPFVVLLTGILRSYISSAWTLTYIDLAENSPSLAKAVIKAPAKPKAPSKAQVKTAPKKVAAKISAAKSKPKAKAKPKTKAKPKAKS